MLCLSILNAAAKICTSKPVISFSPFTTNRGTDGLLQQNHQPHGWINSIFNDMYSAWPRKTRNVTLEDYPRYGNELMLRTIWLKPLSKQPQQSVFSPWKIGRFHTEVSTVIKLATSGQPGIGTRSQWGVVFCTAGRSYVAMCCSCNQWNKICFQSVSSVFFQVNPSWFNE